jgi:hypothetical protein
MTKDEIIKKLRDMAKYPTVTLPRDCEALKAAADLLSEQEQGEPVAWNTGIPSLHPKMKEGETISVEYVELTPPQRTWVGLTDEEISDLWCEVSNTDFVTADTHVFARAIEAKLRSKNENR